MLQLPKIQKGNLKSIVRPKGVNSGEIFNAVIVLNLNPNEMS